MKAQQLADYLRSRMQLGGPVALAGPPSCLYPTQHPSAEELAQRFFTDAEFRALKLGTWLRTTEGSLIAEAVAQVIHPSLQLEYVLVVEALQIAASMQQRTDRRRVLIGGLLVAAVVWVLKTGSA